MTTTVSLTTHSWPVKVTTTDKLSDGSVQTTENEVAPNSTHTAHITSSRSLTFEELPMPAASES